MVDTQIFLTIQLNVECVELIIILAKNQHAHRGKSLKVVRFSHIIFYEILQQLKMDSLLV